MFKGYLNIGASTRKEAINKVGIQINMWEKPNFIRRFSYWFFFNIYWIDYPK